MATKIKHVGKQPFKPSKAQVDLIRRLAQKANRRIKTAFNQYEAAGKHRIPGALTGGKITVKADWETEKYPVSRKSSFASEKEFQAHLTWLKRFDLPEVKGGLPTMSEFSKVQGNKIIIAMQTAIGSATIYDIPPELMEHMYKAIGKMTAPEQTKFWEAFSKRSQKMLDKYSSKAAMEQALNEFFGKEEIRPLLLKSIIEGQGIKTIAGQKAEYDKIKKYTNKALVNYLKTVR